MTPYIGSWKRLAVQGVAAVLFGLATLVWPHVTLWALVVLWGAYAFVDGVTALSAAIADRTLGHRGWVAFWGITSIVASFVTFVWPSLTALGLLLVIAFWAAINGASRIAFAITQRKRVHGTGAIAFSGVLLMLLSLFLIVDPADGAIGVTWAIGWLAFLFGTVQLGLAADLRHQSRALEATGVPTSQPRHAVS